MFMIDLGVESHYSVLGVSPDASVNEIRDKKNDLVDAVKRKLRETKDPEEIKRLKAEELMLTDAGNTLCRGTDREAYNEQNAHLRFFTIQSASIPFYRRDADRLYVLHRVLRAFLAEKGCEILPLTEVERTDFSADESPIQLLDQILANMK
jgi:hypothetical protein